MSNSSVDFLISISAKCLLSLEIDCSDFSGSGIDAITTACRPDVEVTRLADVAR